MIKGEMKPGKTIVLIIISPTQKVDYALSQEKVDICSPAKGTFIVGGVLADCINHPFVGRQKS